MLFLDRKLVYTRFIERVFIHELVRAVQNTYRQDCPSWMIEASARAADLVIAPHLATEKGSHTTGNVQSEFKGFQERAYLPLFTNAGHGDTYHAFIWRIRGTVHLSRAGNVAFREALERQVCGIADVRNRETRMSLLSTLRN